MRAVLVSLSALLGLSLLFSQGALVPIPAWGRGEVVMSTDKPCYAPGEDVRITATGWAEVPSIGSFPTVFWGVSNDSGDPVFQPFNPATAIGVFNGSLEGVWNQTYLLYQDPRSGVTLVPPGRYTIWFFEVPLFPEEYPAGWLPTEIEIGPCDGEPAVTFWITPRTLNAKSEGRWVTAHLRLAAGGAADIDTTSLMLEGVPADWARVLDESALLAKFDRLSVASRLPAGAGVPVCLLGTKADGSSFTVCDAIRVIHG